MKYLLACACLSLPLLTAAHEGSHHQCSFHGKEASIRVCLFIQCHMFLQPLHLVLSKQLPAPKPEYDIHLQLVTEPLVPPSPLHPR